MTQQVTVTVAESEDCGHPPLSPQPTIALTATNTKDQMSYDPANLSCSRQTTMDNYQFMEHRSTLYTKKRMEMWTPRGIPEFDGAAGGMGIDLDHEQRIAELMELDLRREAIPLPHKRVVFLSIVQLNASIESIPQYILTKSLFCFKADRSWFFPSNAAERERATDTIRHRLNLCDQFLRTLADKDSHKMVLWMQLPDREKTWRDISSELSQIEDTFWRHPADHHSPSASRRSARESGRELTVAHLARQISASDTNLTATNLIRRYQPLQLDPEWYFELDALQFATSPEAVAEELATNALRFVPSKEVLFQSNPSLIPMTTFDLDVFVDHHYSAEYAEKQMMVEMERERESRPRHTHTLCPSTLYPSSRRETATFRSVASDISPAPSTQCHGSVFESALKTIQLEMEDKFTLRAGRQPSISQFKE